MHTVLIVDDEPVCREPLAAAFRQRGFHALEASDGNEALALLREGRPDVMLLDLNMPQPDGLAVLRAVRRNPALHDLPVILLTHLSDREHVLRAVERGIQGYILKSHFSLGELFRRVENCLSPSESQLAGARTTSASRLRSRGSIDSGAEEIAGGEVAVADRARRPSGKHGKNRRPVAECGSLEQVKPAISRDDLIHLVNQGLELRPLGPIVGQVVSVTNDAQCSSEDVAKVVMQDQALSIRLLKLANSSAYSRGRPVDSVKDAVQRIGTNEVRSLVLALGVVDQYQGDSARFVNPIAFWEHSIATGLIASAISESRRTTNADDYFLWGLLHDVGRIVMLDHVPDAYANVLTTAERLDLPLELVEPRVVLLDHCDILDRAMEFWQFPRDFIAPVVNHHQSMARIRRLGPKFEHSAATIALADRLAHALLLGGSGNDVIYPIDEQAKALGVNEAMIANIEESVVSEARNLKLVMLSRADSDDWPDTSDQWTGGLSRPVAALFTGAAAALDSFRILFDRVRPSTESTCFNLGVIHLANPQEQPIVFRKFEQLERESECDPLPLLIIIEKGDIDEDDPLPAARRYAVLPSPVRLDRLARTINDLFAEN